MRLRFETLLTIGLALCCCALAAVNLYPHMRPPPVELSHSQPDITVSIAGAVNTPGLYTLPWGSRLTDLLGAAGGLRADAEPTLVNPAMPLGSGQQVMVPFAHTERGEVRLSLNSATLKELETLPGIGPAIGQRIVDGRPYSSAEDLLRVSGIGPKTLEKLRPFVKP